MWRKKPWVFLSAVLTLGAVSVLTAPPTLACGPSGGGCTGHPSHAHAAAASAAKVTYTCPMHPEVTSDKPGTCPKCGMFLEVAAAEKTFYACPMHPEVVSDKPGKCPKCGMDLQKKTEKAAYVYVCPMHPEVTSDKPGKCPKCGMFLEAKPRGDAQPDVPAANPSGGHSH